MSNAASTPRFAYAQEPSRPPSPSGPSRYPCHPSQPAKELVTRPQPTTAPINSNTREEIRTLPYRPRGSNSSELAYGRRRRAKSWGAKGLAYLVFRADPAYRSPPGRLPRDRDLE